MESRLLMTLQVEVAGAQKIGAVPRLLAIGTGEATAGGPVHVIEELL